MRRHKRTADRQAAMQKIIAQGGVKIDAELWSQERASLLERLAKLVGQSTWREPNQGGTRSPNPMPSEHYLAAALSFARGMNPSNPGPEIAFAVATGVPHQRGRVIEWLAEKLEKGTGNAGRRCPGSIHDIATAAYDSMVFGINRTADWPRDALLLISIGAGWLATAMEATLERAEGRIHRKPPKQQEEAVQ